MSLEDTDSAKIRLIQYPNEIIVRLSLLQASYYPFEKRKENFEIHSFQARIK